MQMITLLLAILPMQTDSFTYAVRNGSLEVMAPDREPVLLPMPCAAVAAITQAGRLFVACGDDGVVVFRLTDPMAPVLEGRRDLGGRVTGFHSSAGRVWAETTTVEAQLVLGVGEASLPATAMPNEAAAAVAPMTPSRVPAEGRIGEVTKVRADGLVISLGTAEGLGRGDAIELFYQRSVALDTTDQAVREDSVAVGVVTAVSAKRAHVALGLNEAVDVGAKARRTHKPASASSWLPPRARDLWSVAFSLRPFFALGAAGVGTVSDAVVSYRLAAPVHVQALIEPLGVGLVDEGNMLATSGNLVVSYDTPFFEVGLGAGWSAVNNELSTGLSERSVDGAGVDQIESRFRHVAYGTSIAQVARLGAADGLHLQAHNTFVYFRDTLHYGGTVGRLQVPVGSGSWVLAQGGGGAAGYGYGELGLRWLLFGSGLRQSMFVTASFGGAGLFGDVPAAASRCDDNDMDYHRARNGKCFKEVAYGGPMVGLNVEWRP